jgi:hypothetical protein
MGTYWGRVAHLGKIYLTREATGSPPEAENATRIFSAITMRTSPKYQRDWAESVRVKTMMHDAQINPFQ